MFVLLSVTNAPEGSQIEVSCPGLGPSQPIYIPKTEVKYDPSTISLENRTAVYGIRTTIPANFNSYITYSYYDNGKSPNKGFKLELGVYYIVPKNHKLHNCFYRPNHYGFSDEMVGIGPGNLLLLGGFTTNFVKN